MKILFISNLYPPHVRGGYEILCAQVAQEMATRGHAVTVLTTSTSESETAGPEFGTSTPGQGVDVMRLLRLERPFGTVLRKERALRRLRTSENAWWTRKAIDQVRPDAIMVWSRLRLTVGPSRAAEASGIPVLYTFNDRHPEGFRSSEGSRVIDRLDRSIFHANSDADHRYEHVMAISKSLAAELRASGLPIADEDVMPQGIPLDAFPAKKQPGRLGDPARILVAGQLHPDKGIETAIRAVTRATERGVALRLTIAGTGSDAYVGRLRDLAAKSGAEIEFRGHVPSEQMPALYRDHDLLVFPSSWSEPMGLVHLEAMSSGTTVLSTRTGGSAEVIRHEQNALAFAPGDDLELCDHLCALIGDPSRSERLAQNAREWVEHNHDLSKWVGGIERRLTHMTSVTTGAAA